MKSIISFTIALLGIITTGWGHIGETMEQCLARYGSPVLKTNDESGQTMTFLKNGIVIGVSFHQGVCDELCYFKQDRNILKIPNELSENEIELLLKANSPGEWKRIPEMSMYQSWKSEDGHVLATYNPMKHTLGLMTDARWRTIQQEDKAREAKNLQGL